MNRANAEQIHALISAIFEHANDVLFIVNNSDDADDRRKRTQRAIGTAVAELDLEILEPIYQAFPDLRPSDMEEVGRT